MTLLSLPLDFYLFTLGRDRVCVKVCLPTMISSPSPPLRPPSVSMEEHAGKRIEANILVCICKIEMQQRSQSKKKTLFEKGKRKNELFVGVALLSCHLPRFFFHRFTVALV